MTTLNAEHVTESLRRLSAAKIDIFGADRHRFSLNSPLAEADAVAFEMHHGVRLPAEYRHFLTAIGNGGAGPFYGIFPLGMVDDTQGRLQTWTKTDGIVGQLAAQFPIYDVWNDLRCDPPDELLQTDEPEYWRQIDQFDKTYFASSLVNGAVPICHEGCAIRIWLVLSGGQSGRLWRDSRSEYTGLAPLRLADGSPATFSPWYTQWLEDALRQAGLIHSPPI